LRAAYTDGTKKNLATQWDSYIEFCDVYQNSKIQADVESLTLFVQHISNRLASPGAVLNYLSGVKTMHIINELDISMFDDYLVKMMMRGIKVGKKHVVQKAAVMTPAILLQVWEVLDHTSAEDRTFWALFLLAFFLLARKSNLVPDSVAKFDAGKQVTRGDVVVKRDCLLVTLKWSKTNQTGRKEEFPLLINEGNNLCPVKAYREMVSSYPAHDTSPAFLLKRYGRVQTVTYRQFQDKLKKCVSAIGLDAKDFTSHSFRRGGATYAFQCGLSANHIKKLGDWKSDAYLEYIDCPLADRLVAGKKIRDSLNK